MKKQIYSFLQWINIQRCFNYKKTGVINQHFFRTLFASLLLLVASISYADTYIDFNSQSHFKLTSQGFSSIDFAVLTYDFSGNDDRLQTAEFWVREADNATWTKIHRFAIGNNNAMAKWEPVNTEYAGYISSNSETEDKGLRFANFRWQYPARFAGRTLQFKINYEWNIDWYQKSGVDVTSTYLGSNATASLPSYTPTISSASIIANATDKGTFSFNRTAGSLLIDKVSICSDAARTNKMTEFAVAISATSGTTNFLWNNNFTVNTRLYVRYGVTIPPVFAGAASREFVYDSEVAVSGYNRPINLDKNYNNCNKSFTLTWNVNDEGGTLSNKGTWVVDRKLTTEAATLYKEVANSIASNLRTYEDQTLDYDKSYDYRLHFVPEGMDKVRIIPEFNLFTSVNTKRSVLNTFTFTTYKKTSAENPKIQFNWTPNWCFNPTIHLQQENTVTKAVINVPINSTTNNATTFTHENLTENLMYKYRLKVTTEGTDLYTDWQNVIIKDEVKYKSVTSSKGTLADRIQLKWDVERNDLSNSFFIKRQIFEEGRENPKEDITNITTNGKYYSFEDRNINPGILYKYTLGSQFTLSSGIIDTVYYKADIIGYAQASGTVSGRITFGSGSSVDSVSVFASNANESESLYRAIKFKGTGGLGEVALSTKKHGCVKDGFTWQAWLQPQDATSDMAVYECFKEYSIWYENSTLKVYLDQIDPISPLISFDMSYLKADEYVHASVSFDGDSKLKLFVNGKSVSEVTLSTTERALVNVCPNVEPRTNNTIAYLGDGFLFKGSYKGNVDDMRLWDRELTAKEIAENYNRYINGNESGLIGYWQFDEGLNRYAFDRSNYKKIFNEHHITFTQAESTKAVPTLEQLSIKGISDKNGNYLISGIPFTGDGSTYAFTPSKQSHEFEPSQLNRHLTYQTSVHDEVDFKDVSSFKVRVNVTYDNTTFPVDSVDVLIDGANVYKDKQILSTNSVGDCIVDVPIGIHTISVSRRGHSFVDGNKNTAVVSMNFKEPILGNPIKFFDTTKTILAGRVVGGVVQGSQPLGFGLSKANIGEAEITIEVPDGDYVLNPSSNAIKLPGAITDTISSSATIAADSKVIKVVTDPKTGEFRVLLPPLKYKVTEITTRGGLRGKDFVLTEFNIDPNVVLSDTANINKNKKKFSYNHKLNFTYRVDKISIDVIDPTMPAKVFGDSIFTATNLTNGSSIRIPLYKSLNNNPSTPDLSLNQKPQYKYDCPIYQTTKIYKLRVFAYEQYTHPDNLPEMADFCKVPASNASISIENELGRYELPIGSDGNPENLEATENNYSFNSEGVFDYRFKAGFPNLVAPYKLGLDIEVNYEGKKSSWDGNSTFEAIVMGDILTGTDFVTAGPNLISFVLRDPPGSNSYSYMEKGTTISNSYSFSKSYVGSESLLGTINYGQKISLAYGGLFVLKLDEVEIDNKTGGGVEIEQSAGNGNEFNVSTTTTERLETSSSSDYVGRRGDVYVGTSTNMFFGTSRRLNPDLASGEYVLKVKDEKVGNLSAETNFKYTYAHITETLIPNLKKLRNDLIETVPSMTSAEAYVAKSRYVTELKPTDENFAAEKTYRFIEPSTKTAKQYENEVLKYNNSIDGWIAQLAEKEDEKIAAMDSKDESVYTKSNISADAGVVSEKSVTICGSSSKTKTSSFSRQGVFKTENGFAYNNTGFQFEFETKHGAESESVTGSGEEYCTTYGYVIADENAGDYLSVDVYSPVVKSYNVEGDLNSKDKIKKEFDTYSGAPLFVTRGGRTSCPYEPQDVVEYSTKNKGKALGVATLQVEKPLLRVSSSAYANDIPSGKEASFKIELSNLSESNTAGWYMLTVDEKTNAKGAIITVDGQTLGNGKMYYIVPNEPMTKVLKLKQSSLDELEYQNIKLLLSSTCDGISSTTNISAQFIPSCSDVTLEITNKIINSTTSDILPIKIKDYNLDYKNLGGILLQYKTINQDENGWTTIRKFVKDQSIVALDQTSQLLTSASTDYLYSLKGKDDQTYQFRAITVCKNGTGLVNNESEVITVIKDMVTPTSLGNPSPSNGILTPESEVSITFNEDIQNSLLNSSNFKVEGVLNGNALKHNVGLSFTGANEAYTEQQFNLQSVPVSVEGWIKTQTDNSNATLFAIGEGTNQLKLQLNGNVLKAIAGTEEYTGNINADENWQYVSLGYNPTSKKLTVNVTGQMNNNVKVINQTLTGSVEPSGRLSVGKGFKGELTQLSLWINSRELADMAVDRNTSKSGREIGLIGYWPLNEGSGTLAADKVNSRSLTLNTGWYIDPKGKAVQLNGTNQNVLISTATIPVTNNQDYSVEFWFKAGQQTNTSLFSCGKGVDDLDLENNLSVGFDAAGKLTVYAKGVAHLITNDNLQDNQWHHFAISVLRRGNTNVLVDGILKYQVVSSKFGGLEANKMSLGARYYKTDNVTYNYTTDQYLNGMLDELRIWKGALTAENIRLDMNNKLNGSETGLIAYYPFEEYTVNGASQTVITGSLKDAIVPSEGQQSGGVATGTVAYTDLTPAIKEARVKENVYFNWTSTNNKIVFNILEPLKRIENCVLEFTIDRALDLNGNRMAEPVKWTVFVDNNRLKWESDKQSLKKEVLAPLTFKTNIVNNSGKYENFVIDGLPTWLSVNKSSGTLNPLEKSELTFTVNNSVNVGLYETRISLTGNNGIQELLPVALKVTGARPDWTVNPYDYESSMNVTGQVKIEGVYQEDTEDILAAFNGTKCVGIAQPQFNKLLNSYFVYLDIYGNSDDTGKELTFSLWDAGTGRIYPGVDVVGGAIQFVSGAITGNVASPKIFNATDKVEQQLNVKQGWTWLSTNVVSTTPSLLEQVKTGLGTDGLLIKSKANGYVEYATGAWSGTLSALNQNTMYLLKSTQAKTVKVIGATAKTVSYPITINSSWNWIGYIPQFVAPVKEALSGLTANEGDQIKGQIGYATYTDGTWNGSLDYLVPGLGYMYYSTAIAAKSFVYPSQYISKANVKQNARSAENMYWSFDGGNYQSSMTVTSVAKINDLEVASTNVQVGVFIDDVCRGTVEFIYNSNKSRYIAYISIWGNTSDLNKKVIFKSYDVANNKEYTASDNVLDFVPDNIVGNAANPYTINFNTVNSNPSGLFMGKKAIYPNPVVNTLNFNYDPQGIERLEIVDCTGRTMVLSTAVNKNSINVSDLIPGIYTLRVNYMGTIRSHRFIKK